jgi:hypothetical protein
MTQTLEERERYWYVTGWPVPATPQDVDLALAAEGWINAAGDHDLNTPAELAAALDVGRTDKLRAEQFKEALHTLAASDAVTEAGAAAIAEFLKAPDLHDFDRLLG